MYGDEFVVGRVGQDTRNCIKMTASYVTKMIGRQVMTSDLLFLGYIKLPLVIEIAEVMLNKYT